MIKDFFEWFTNWDVNKNFSLLDISPNGFFASGISNISKGFVTCGNGDYYIKTPHSRAFKFGYVNLKHEVEDNKLATVSELVGQKRYKRFKFLYANHRPILREKLSDAKGIFDNENLWKYRHTYNYVEMYKNGIYALVSPALTNENINTISMGDMSTIGLQLTRGNKAEQSMYDNFERMLDCKRYYLKYMTPDCYDQVIRFVLASIFDFSDDDHFYNVLLCKNKESSRYESIFIFDKESTAFNQFIVQKMPLNEIKYKTQKFTSFNGMPIKNMGERSLVRMYEITRLILNGKLETKYVNFLEEIAGVNFNKIATEIYEETGIKVNNQQLDMYKYGADLAGIISGKEL